MEEKLEKKILKQDLKTMSTAKKMSTVTEMLIILIMVGLFQFTTMNFNLACFTEISFYTKLLYRVVLIYLAYTTGLELFFDKHYYSERMLTEKETYRQLLKFKNRKTFPAFIKKENFKRKTDVYKKQFEKKINKIEKKLMAMMSETKRQKLVKELDHYKNLISDEYIEEHLDNIFLKYKIVYESDFNGSEFLDGADGLKTRSDYPVVKNRYTLRKILPFIIFTIIVGVTLRDVVMNGVTIMTFINLLADLLFISMRFRAGIDDSERAVNEAYLLPIVNKNNLLKEYIEENDEQMSKVEKIVQAIEEQKG